MWHRLRRSLSSALLAAAILTAYFAFSAATGSPLGAGAAERAYLAEEAARAVRVASRMPFYSFAARAARRPETGA